MVTGGSQRYACHCGFKKSYQTIKFWFIPNHGSQKSENRLWYIESQFSKNLRTSQTSFNEIAGYFKKAADSSRFSVKEIETKNKNQKFFFANLKKTKKNRRFFDF